MPYKLRKAPNRDLYWVVNKETGKKHSIQPLTRSRAESQMRLLYAVENGYVLRPRTPRNRSARGPNSRGRRTTKIGGGKYCTDSDSSSDSSDSSSSDSD